jgi:hypothetical protein
MRREVIAILLLILLLGILLGNIRYLDNLVEDIEEAVSRSSAAWERGNTQLAVSELETAMERWQSAADYAHIFLRQSEIDAVSDAFFDLSASLRAEEKQSQDDYLRLFYHLDSLERMDALRLSSIF